MKSGQQFSRSHIGYTRLGKSSNSSIITKLKHCKMCCAVLKLFPKFNRFFSFIGYYFCFSIHYAPIALLPVTLLFLIDTHSVVRSITYIVFIIIFLVGILYEMQDRLLYHPNMPETSRIFVGCPPLLIPHEEVTVTTGDKEKLHGFLLKQSDDRLKNAPTFVYFHGNAGNASSPSVLPLYENCGANVLMLDYRGYGLSTGFPSEEGLYRDGEAAVRYLHSREDIDLNKIILYGHSLGGAVAIHIASSSQWVKGRVAAVILENTFTTLQAVACSIFESIFSCIHYLPRFCFKNKFESISKVANIQVPVLFLYGDADQVVPPFMSRLLYTAAANPRSALVEVPNGTHNDTWCASAIYHSAISHFLQKVIADPDIALTVPERTEERVALSHQWLQDVVGTSHE